MGKPPEPEESKEYPGDNARMKSSPFGKTGTLGESEVAKALGGLWSLSPHKNVAGAKERNHFAAYYYLKIHSGDHFPCFPKSSAVHTLGTTHLFVSCCLKVFFLKLSVY